MRTISKMFFLLMGLLSPITTMAQTEDFQQEIEELSYAIGLTQTKGLEGYLTDSLKVDLAHKDSFIKGVLEGAEHANVPESAAYYVGIQIGVQIGAQMIKGINKEIFGGNNEYSISLKDFLNGFIAGIKGVSEDKMNKASEIATEKLQKVKAIMLEKEYGK